MSSNRDLFLRCRLLVGFLGERAQFAWWSTAFFDAPSRQFLDPIFSKTSQLAQYHGVVEAARRQHDEHLNVGSYHLFRLPEEIEQDLHNIARDGITDSLWCQTPLKKENALAALAEMAEGQNRNLEGPTLVGGVSEIDTNEIVKKIAGIYYSAFTEGKRAYPYLASFGGRK